MVRNLYRFYLYTIFIALIVFSVSALNLLLSTILAFTPLRGTYSSHPNQAAVVQALVFALVSWLVSGVLGGLHYWLIRRDIRSDPEAGTSAIRAFFLNGTELVGTLLTTLFIGIAIGTWAYSHESDITGFLSIGLASLCMVTLLELERRRIPLQKGLALVFQRLHFFGGQFLLLIFLSVAFFYGLRPFIAGLFFRGQGSIFLCGYSTCTSPGRASLGLELLWFLLCWLVYGWVTSQDTSRNVRMLLHGLGLAIGTIYTLLGIFIALEFLLSPLFHIKVGLVDVLGLDAQNDFVSPLLTGLVVVLVYHLLLRSLSKRALVTSQVRNKTEWAIVATLMGVAFWIGCGYGLYNLLQASAHLPAGPDSHDWLETLALIVTVVGYIGLDLFLQRASRLDTLNVAGPRRGFVLALLGGGLLAFASGGATALYTWGTALLGSPIGNWMQAAHGGLAACIVGAIIIAIYLWATLREHLVGHGTSAEQPSSPPATPVVLTPVPAITIEGILDELLANRISREEAAQRLREVKNEPVAF